MLLTPQSMFHALGVEAEAILRLWWPMLAGAVAVELLVVGLLLYALLRDPARRARIHPGWFIFGGGVALPVLTLTALLAATLGQTARLRPEAGAEPPVQVEVVGRRWWWELRYLGGVPQERVVNATELHLPAGRDVRIRLLSHDVVHSFWIPSLAGKIDVIPGVPNTITLRPTQTGRVRGQCAEFCGAQHAHMLLDVVIEPPEVFDEWLAWQRRPALEPRTPQALAGKLVFMRSGCALCHRIAGTPARGTVGPDLTHVASRARIAGGMLENNRANMAAWVTHAQSIKPEAQMPDMTQFTGEELHALVAYLASLE